MFKATLTCLLCFSAFLGCLNAWEDHPDKEDHKETDRIFRECQRLTKADKYEIILIERKAKEEREKLLGKRQRHEQNR